MNTASNSALLEPDVSPPLAEEHSPFRVSHSPFRATLLCCVALLAALAWPFFAGRVYVADDLGAFHLPLRAFYARQLAAGEPFDWNPELFGGFYLTGEGQAGTYHPLHWLLYRFLPLPAAFDLECLLSYPFMLAGMYVFLRRWRLRPPAALFGAMTFTFGGFNLLHFVHPNVVAIVAHLPWLLAALDVLQRGANMRVRRFAYTAIALLTASQLLLGSPQFVLLSLLLELGYVLWIACRGQTSGRAIAGRFSLWASAVLIGGLIGGIQLLPTIDTLKHSVRQSAGADLAAYGSLQPLNLIQLVAPYLFVTRVVGQNTHELGLYIGAVPLVLAAWWMFGGPRTRSRNSLTGFAAATALLAILWAFGALGPLGWLEANLPIVNRFRFPSRAIVLFHLAVAALAALGFAALMRPSKSLSRNNSGAWLWSLPAGSAALALMASYCWPEHIAAWPLVVVGPLAMAAAVWLLIRVLAGSHWALTAIVIFAAADLGAYGLSYSVLGQNESLTDYIRTTDTPPGQATGRLAVDLMSGTEIANGQFGPRVGDRIVLTPWKCIDGYAGLEPARRLDYRQPAALLAAGVTWISADAAANLAVSNRESIAPTAQDGWFAIYNSQPRAWLVTRTSVSANPAADIANIRLADEALLDQPISSPLVSGTPGTVKIVADRPGQIRLAVDCPTAQFLVANESYHQGWRATLDGQSARLVRANGDFLGLPVPPGGHEIRLEFRPESLVLGRAVSGFGLGLIGVLVFWPRLRFVAN